MKKIMPDRTDERIDRLLAGVLQDDLPPEVEDRMKSQMLQFQDKFAKQQRQAWYLGMLPKTALAAAAILMVVIGGLLQAAGPRSTLAENISRVRISLRVSSRVANSTSMLCSVELRQENGESREYVVRWLSTGLKRVDIRPVHQDVLQTIWISETEITVADYARDTVQKFEHLDQLPDPLIPPLLALLSPASLSEFLYGEWQLRRRQLAADCEMKTYAIFSPQQEELMEMTVDLCAFLPVEIQKSIPFPLEGPHEENAELKIKFQWNAPIPQEVMDPRSGVVKKNV